MVDAQAIMSLEIIAIKEQAKVYGPVLSRMAGISAAKFVADRLHETAPTIDKLDQAVAYITKNLSRYHKGFTALAYGVYKAVNMLEGNSGGGIRIFRSTMQAVMKSMGIEKILGHVPGTTDAVAKNTKFAEDMNVVEKGITTVSGDDNCAVETTKGCDYIDVCKQMVQEGVVRATVGGPECTYGLSDAATAAILTGVEHDYTVLRFEPPICEYKIFRPEK